MKELNRKQFLTALGLTAPALALLKSCSFKSEPIVQKSSLVSLSKPKSAEGIIEYLKRTEGGFAQNRYCQIIGAANEFKEGDEAIGLAAKDETTRMYARQLLSNTSLQDIKIHTLFEDELFTLISKTTLVDSEFDQWTLGHLKEFILTETEEEIKKVTPFLNSDQVGCLVKLCTNEELIIIGQKVFNPLANSKIGAKGYMSARVQPNSPTDNTEDIIWQVFNAWSYAVGDLVLGTNPVSSEVKSVAAIEEALFDIIQTFELENTISNCVLAHIDVQSAAENQKPGTTGIWFQSLAGTVNANQTFDLTIEKMQNHVSNKTGKFGLYAETGQGADFTNGHGEGFDMVIHESRKYGFLRALKQQIENQTPEGQPKPWVHVNDVAGFIGPEVFKTKEQLVRCCLEDTVMGKLHGLTIGLDICSTLHMDVTLEELDWCIEQIMPANPAYLMALPTKNDPMLSYLTTAFHNHLKIREKFGYKINDDMWAFFKKLGVIDESGKPTEHFGDPIWVYYQFLKAKGDIRSFDQIKIEAEQALVRIKNRGVPVSRGYGDNYWDPEPELAKETKTLYEDAKVSLWTPLEDSFVSTIPGTVPVTTQSLDRKDYVYHPVSGEQLSDVSIAQLKPLKSNVKGEVQIVISDGLNARAIMDENHLKPFLESFSKLASQSEMSINSAIPFFTNGRVRAGYAAGEILLGSKDSKQFKTLIHIIGERPGSGHHNFSVYITVANAVTWNQKGNIDHDITRVVSGISDTALKPEEAAKTVLRIIKERKVELQKLT
ncbi:ethanolamine ammonia-lyase subunit EutB [Jiulongibacter sp. NS-SX5]|uniref:ethanolamine ammonia-lyase subunit EutB n=1 Tax=Jiulongibacter sp. NS-SX5 TaxID=3463854 RepID=UPI004059EBD6